MRVLSRNTRVHRVTRPKRSVELFCSTFECIKLYCVPASIVPDVAMSGAARVNEPFPGPLAAEYYIDNRNWLRTVRGREDVLLETPPQPPFAPDSNRLSPFPYSNFAFPNNRLRSSLEFLGIDPFDE